MPQTIFQAPELDALLGREVRLAEVARALAQLTRRLLPTRLCTLHVTCSDEREKEVADTFQALVVRDLAEGERARRAPMRTANLGARYEWGAGPVAMLHFRNPGDTGVVAIAKINGHVGVQRENGHPSFGLCGRPVEPSASCGALAFTMDGGASAFSDELRLILSSEGVDRLRLLLDPQVVPPEYRMLVGAAVSARLQARQAMLDLLSMEGPPDRLLVPSCVTFNQPGRDHEILLGYYAAEVPEGEAPGRYKVTWTGLGDDPRSLVVQLGPRGVRLLERQEGQAEPGIPPRRLARGPRQHRRLPSRTWLRLHGDPQSAPLVTEDLLETLHQLESQLHDPAHPVRSLALKALVTAMAEGLAVPALLVLFATGALDLHHAWRMHRIAAGQADHAEVELLLQRAIEGLDRLDAATTERVIRVFEDELA